MASIPFGDYLLNERIGLGGTAEIFRAARRGRRPGEPEVALKRLLPPLAEDPEIAKLFLREVGALDRIRHPGVVRLLDHGEVAGLPFLVMPLHDGATLRELLQRGPLPSPVALTVAADVALALTAAHAEGVVHRDVSPTNVLIDAQGHVLVIDFGIARVAGLAQTTKGGALRGKWPYLSPEQVAGEPIDGRSDLFALGSVLCEMLTGAPPFQGSDPHDTMARIQIAEWPEPPIDDREISRWLKRLLSRLPTDRPADVAGMAAAWQAMAGDVEARLALAERVARIERPGPRRELVPAELRGEPVTQPQFDADATQVRRALA
jgi:serine/threonine-protein kinase